MKKNIFAFLILALFSSENFAQRKVKQPEVIRCSTHEKMMELRALDPEGYDKNQAKQEQILQQWIANNYNAKAKVIYTIPVVVQIFGSSANTAVTDNRVNEQITVLNQDYRRTNTDTNLTPTTFKSLAADCEIEFCLATIDPQGNATTGIVRYPSWSGTTPSNSYLWNPSQYLNLFVYNIGGGTLGYTYLPSSPNNAVHIGYQYFGKTGASAPYNKGRTATHEVGHWFNLNHIWGDANCGNDNISDTPTQQNETYGCPGYPNAAGCSSPNPPGRMFQNYMDYSNDACMNIFTAGQKARMISAINNSRPGLLNNGKCGTSSNPPTAAFTANQTTVVVGACVNFTNQSVGNPTSYSWTFQGGTPATSNVQNPSNICYNDTGCYNVTLIVSNSNGGDTLVQTCYVNVIEQSSLVCDTISNFKLTDTPTVYGSDNWGYVTGHNGYDDRTKADFFTAPPSGLQITGAKFWFAKADAGSTNSTIEVTIWADNGGTPGSILYTQTVPINQLQIFPNETFINFTTPQIISGDYYLGIQLTPNGTPQDTVALISSTDGETDPCPSWEQWNDGDWYNIDVSWGGVKIAQAIWTIRCPADSGTACNLSASVSSTGVSCNGGNDGSVSVTVSGNPTPLTYSWSNGTNSATVTGLQAGNYTVTATDSNGCTATASATISQPAAISASASSTPAGCGGNDGAASVTVSGGTSPYGYAWNTSPVQSSAAATGLSAGTYKVTVTDASGCNAIANANVSNVNGPTVSATFNDCSAFGACDGSAALIVSGGTSPYNYLWNNGATTQNVSGLCANTYNVTVTDTNNCVAIISVTISEPLLITKVPQDLGINIFPNPNGGKFTIYNAQFSIYSMKIYNVIGETIYQSAGRNAKSEIDISNFPMGIYFVEISSNEKTFVRKISLMK